MATRARTSASVCTRLRRKTHSVYNQPELSNNRKQCETRAVQKKSEKKRRTKILNISAGATCERTHTAFCLNDFFDTVGFYSDSITKPNSNNHTTTAECTWSLESQLCTIYIEQSTIKRNAPSCAAATKEDVEFHSDCKLKGRSTIKILHEFFL